MVKAAVSHTGRLRRRYVPLLERHGDSHRALDWGSRASQRKRFDVLLGVAPIGRESILDVGCGLGHLVDRLERLDFRGRYLGIDALPEFVSAAHAAHPGWQFRVADICSGEFRKSADYVLASGVFTFATRPLAQEMIRRMFGACRRAVAFNCLSTWADRGKPDEFQGDPIEFVAFCRQLTRNVVLRHEYLPHDFTIYLYKAGAGR